MRKIIVLYKEVKSFTPLEDNNQVLMRVDVRNSD